MPWKQPRPDLIRAADAASGTFVVLSPCIFPAVLGEEHSSPRLKETKAGGASIGARTDAAGSNAVSPSPTSFSRQSNHPKVKQYDWIEAWQPADEGSENEPPTTPSRRAPSYEPTRSEPCQHAALPPRERMRNFAVESRAALTEELEGIRGRPDRLATVASVAAGSPAAAPDPRARGRARRTCRENLARSGAASARARERKRRRQLARARGNKRRKTDPAGSGGDDEFLLAAYRSDEEVRDGDVSSDSDGDDDDDDDDDNTALNDLLRADAEHSHGKPRGTRRPLSAKALLEGSNLDGSGYQNDPERNARARRAREAKVDGGRPAVGAVAAGSGLRKIVYAARTHSQLSQFVGELRRTHWGKTVKVAALGSRSLLCCNEDVMYSSASKSQASRRGEADITEMCLDMQKNKKDAGERRGADGERANTARGCPYLSSAEAVSTLALHSLAKPSDIEDLANLGKASHSCSYYASREAVAAAEVVVLPYNTLLSRQARESVGLSIKNALVVIDEAHSIPETLRNISSCRLSLRLAQAALSQLLAYTRKYSGRLKGRNVFYLGQIRRILLAMVKYLKRPPVASGHASEETKDGLAKRKEMMAAVDLMFRLKLSCVAPCTCSKKIEYVHKSG